MSIQVQVQPKELNPYFKENGSGYEEDGDGTESDRVKLPVPPPCVVGDGGASWRFKALKRAEEQAAREGQRLDEVVEQRWGSLGQLAVSVAASIVAPSRSHLHAIRNRKRGLTNEDYQVSNRRNERDSRKAIDEAEEEWSQHNAKSLIDTSLSRCKSMRWPIFCKIGSLLTGQNNCE